MFRYYTCFLLCFSVLIGLLFTANHRLSAQENYATDDFISEEHLNTSVIKEETWKKAIQGVDYDNEKIKEEAPKEEKEKKEKEAAKEGLSAELKQIIKYSLFGIVILLIGFIIYRLILGGLLIKNSKLQREEEAYALETIENNLNKANIEHFLDKALASENYRLAIRLYYLAILQKLSLAGMIAWERDKTNATYLKELNNHPQRDNFQRITYFYEYVWFNEAARFEKRDYEALSPKFNTLLKAISSTNQASSAANS